MRRYCSFHLGLSCLHILAASDSYAGQILSVCSNFLCFFVSFTVQALDFPDVVNPANPADNSGRYRIKIVSTQKTFVVLAPSAADKESWMKDVQKVLNERKDIENKLVTRLKGGRMCAFACALHGVVAAAAAVIAVCVCLCMH